MPAEHQRVFFIEEKASRTPESFLYRGKGLPSTREFSLSRERPAEHQRVFFIEEKACRAPESFLYRGKGLPSTREFSLSRKRPARRQRPEPRGVFLSWKRNPIRTRAPPALASGTLFVPFAHVDRPVRR